MKYFALLLTTLSCFGNNVVPGDRLIQWDPGVRGGIPTITNEFVRLSPSTNTWAITQAALDACPSNSFVLLLNGVHQITNDLNIRQNGIVLRGENMTNTILFFTNLASIDSATLRNRLFIFDRNYDFDWNDFTAVPLQTPLKGCAYVTSSVPHSLALFDKLIIDTRTNFYGSNTFVANNGTNLFPISNAGTLGNATWVGREAGGRPMGQFALVTEVLSSTVVKIDPPLYHSYQYSPELYKITGWTERCGLENFSISNSVRDNIVANARDNVVLQGTYNCWFKDIWITGCKRRDFWTYGAFWCTWQGVRLTGAIPPGNDYDTTYISDRAYPIFFGPHVTACLVTDSIFEKKTMGIAWEGCASGNVVSYNLFTNIWWQFIGGVDTDYQKRFSLLMHGPHPAYNLFEGNWCSDRVRADEYWGTSSHNLCAWNSIHEADRGVPQSQAWTVDIERNNDYWSFVGNEIGGGSILEGNYEYINGESAPYVNPVSTIWKIGYSSLGNGITNYSFNTMNTILRYGNWCYRTNDDVAGSGITYHSDNVEDPVRGVIPPSFYLTTAPTNFGILSKGWPRLGAHRPGASFTNIPAGYRYQFGTNPPPVTNVGSSKVSGIIQMQGISRIQ